MCKECALVTGVGIFALVLGIDAGVRDGLVPGLIMAGVGAVLGLLLISLFIFSKWKPRPKGKKY